VLKLPGLIERVNLDPAVPRDRKPVTARMIRFLIAEGVVAKPDGWNYGEDHVLQVVRYFGLRAAGLSVAQIAAIRQGGTLAQPVVIELAPGVVLHVQRGVFGSAPALADALARIAAAVTTLNLPAPIAAPDTPSSDTAKSEIKETTDAV